STDLLLRLQCDSTLSAVSSTCARTNVNSFQCVPPPLNCLDSSKGLYMRYFLTSSSARCFNASHELACNGEVGAMGGIAPRSSRCLTRLASVGCVASIS